MTNIIPADVPLQEDEVPSVFYADIQSHGLQDWDFAIESSTAPRNADIPDSYGGKKQDKTANDSTCFNVFPMTCGEYGSFDNSMFGNVVSSTSFEVLQAEASPFDTTQISHIAFEDPRVMKDAVAESTIDAMFHEPHLDLGDNSRLRGVHHVPYDSTDPSGSRLYPLMLEEVDKTQPVSRVTDNAPWSHQGLGNGSSNLLTPWGGEAHNVWGHVSPILSHYGHMRSSSSPNLQLHSRDSSILLLWRQEAYVSASSPIISSRHAAPNLS